MKYSFFFLISIFLLSPLAIFAEGEWCAIEKWPPPLLTAYMKEVQRVTSEIRSQASTRNQCNGTNGSFSNEKRFLSLLDRIDAQNPVFPSLMTDFQYNILLVANGDARAPVINQGKVIQNGEKSIINTMKSVSSVCALDFSYNGGTFESVLTNMLVKNKSIEAYYKNVALGNTRNVDNIDGNLTDEIAKYYDPGMTQNCKSNTSIADTAGKILERIQNLGKKTQDSDKNWKEAIALFRGTSTLGNYNDIQKSLLDRELSRQWLSRRAVDLMIGNLSCVQQKTSQTDSIEDWGKARSECFSNVVIGSENLTNWMKRSIIQATNTDQYLARVLLYSKRKDQSSQEMTKFWTKINALAIEEDQTTNEKMMTDLVDLHVRLLETNDLLKKKIPEMQANCRKWQPGIPCPK